MNSFLRSTSTFYLQSLPSGNRVIRVMTNTPALVGTAASVYSRGVRATQKDVDTCCNLLKAVGTCEEVQEGLMDPITALSGSGPAYVIFVNFFLNFCYLEVFRFMF